MNSSKLIGCGNEIVGPCLDTTHVVVAGHQNDRQKWRQRMLDPAADVEAVDIGEDYVEYHQVDSRIRARCQRELAILHSVVAGSRYAEKLEGLAAAAGGVDVVEAMAFEYGTV